MLSLCVCFLAGCYILKIFFPEQFVMVIENEAFIKIGTFVDEHIWLYYIVTTIVQFTTYWVFACACKQEKYLNWKECLVILGLVVLATIVKFFDANITSHIRICTFFSIPFIFKHDLKRATIFYTIHGLSQVLSLSIRNLPMYLTNVNSVIAICISIESYLWLSLFYIISNYKKKEI